MATQRSVDRCYVGVRPEGSAELLPGEKDGCNDGLEPHHQIRTVLGDVLTCRFVFKELAENSRQKKHC